MVILRFVEHMVNEHAVVLKCSVVSDVAGVVVQT